MRSLDQILNELSMRDAHMRQYAGEVGYYELWIDGEFRSWYSTSAEVETALRALFAITDIEMATWKRRLIA